MNFDVGVWSKRNPSSGIQSGIPTKGERLEQVKERKRVLDHVLASLWVNILSWEKNHAAIPDVTAGTE